MPKLSRFNGWVALVAFSCVALGSLVKDFSVSFRGPKENYIISCCSIAIILGFLAFIGHFVADGRFVSSPFESVTGVIVFGLWCAAIAVIQNPKNSLAVTAIPAIKAVVIRNANLYFFSWASFLSSVYILSSMAQEHKVVNVKSIPTRLMRWYLLFVIGGIVLLAVGSKHKDIGCSKLCPNGTENCFDEELCRRTNYAVTLGVITAFLSIVPIAMAHFDKMFPIFESIIAFVILVFFCVGVGTITDNQSGPGGNIGNLYFASWFGFYLSVFLSFTCLKMLICPEEEEEEQEGGEGSGMGKSESNRSGKGDVAGQQEKGDQVEEIEA